MTAATQSKKPVEFFFIDMNDPDRYKKLKVAQACDFCRRRKSKCDLGVPGSGVCSNCQRAGIKCVFGSQPSKKEQYEPSSHRSTAVTAINFSEPIIMCKKEDKDYNHHHQQQDQHIIPTACEWIQQISDMFPLLDIKNSTTNGVFFTTVPVLSNLPYPLTLERFEDHLLEHYFISIHPLYPVLDNTHGDSIIAVAAMPAHQRSAVLALTCSLSYPDLTSLSTFYAQKAFLGLGTAANLASAQTLLLLYHHQETIILPPTSCCPDGITQQPPYDDAYLDRARIILDQLPQDDRHVTRAQWMLYLHVCWAGYADTGPWKRWCLGQSYQSLAMLPSDLASFCSFTLAAFQYSPWLGDGVNSVHGEKTRQGSFDQYCALIQDMMVLPYEHVRAAERIEAHVRLLAGTMAQRAAIQSHHDILRALKMSLHAYISFYAASLSLDGPATPGWICQRLVNTMELFEQLGAHPDLCSSVQDLIYHLSR